MNNSSNAQAGSWYLSGSTTSVDDETSAADGTGNVWSAVTAGALLQYGGWINRVAGTGNAWWGCEIADSGKNHLAWCPINSGIFDGPGPTGWNFYENSMTVPANGAYVRFYAEIHGGNDADTSLTTAYFDTAVLSTSASLWSQAFTYDSFGNITKNATVGISFTPGYSTAKNQFTSLSGVTPTYDGRGDLTYDGTHNYGWISMAK